MPAFVSTLIFLMAVGTLVLDVVIVGGILALFKSPWRAELSDTARTSGLLLIFMLSTLAIAGTLVMQYARALNPCVLCWWQRVFMYPIPLISLIALARGQKLHDIADYLLALACFGALFAFYQHLLQVLPQGALIPCGPSNDCAVRAVFYFNFVTIPWMALTVFAAIFLIALLGRSRGNVSERNPA